MVKNRILQPEENYSFRSYFELPYEADEILAEFDYQLLKEELKLPKSEVKLTGIETLKTEIKTILPYINLSNETARRETLVAPILLKIVAYCHCQSKDKGQRTKDKGNFENYLKPASKLIFLFFSQLAIELSLTT